MRHHLSWIRRSSVFVVTVFVLALAGQARAGDVDWSQYIEDKPARPLKSEPAPAVEKTAKSSRAKKTVAKKSSAKARKAKRAAKSKKTRRR
jgi:hypothetical protein